MKVLLPFVLMGATAMAHNQLLASHQWNHRLILLFAESAENIHYQQQLKALENYPLEQQDRDLKIYHLFPNYGHGPDGPLDEAQVNRLYQDFAIASDFTFILIGKDGGMKRREHGVVASSDLFEQIDAMPMRQREMREGQ